VNGPVPASSPGPAATDRLSGWKDIATFLGKGVRTVQRWEKEFGLPVHRLGKDGGEIVLASKHEIEQWLETWTHRSRHPGTPTTRTTTGTPVAEPAPPVSPAPVATPPRARSRERRAPRWGLALAGVLLTTVVGAVAWRAASGRVPPGSPGCRSRHDNPSAGRSRATRC
jgi:hypothetical protein